MQNWSKPDIHPDHITINYGENPAKTASVLGEHLMKSKRLMLIAVACFTKFWRNAKTIAAKTETLDFNGNDRHVLSNYHSVTFDNLESDVLYAYRVGDGRIWSEWLQFKTASEKEAPFSFLYVGDAQNYILELWSRLIREGYRKGPNASFIIHAGDLINDAHDEDQWHDKAAAIHKGINRYPKS